MLADYLRAAFPETFTVLGQRLHPFSLGHALLLQRLENAYVTGDREPNQEDLVTGVFVCAHRVEEAIEELQNPELPGKLEEWGRRCVRQAKDGMDYFRAFALFADYLDKGSLWPDLHEPEDANLRMPGAPFLQRVKLILQRNLNHTPSEALNKPLGEALYDYFAYWEIEKAVKISNQDDIDHMSAVEEFDRAHGIPEGPNDGA